MLGPLSFVVVFGLLIFVHELGHFAAAKIVGARVDEFGFGYPPRLAVLGKWRETAITINWLPFGGFVRMAEDDPTVKDGLANKGRLARAFVMGAGSLMNLVLAIVLYSITFMTGALTPVEGPGAGIYFVSPDSPAMEAGVRGGDNLIAIDGVQVGDLDDVIDLIDAHLGQEIEFELERNERQIMVRLTPRENPPPNEGATGISLGDPWQRVRYPVWKAVPNGFRAAYNSVSGIFYMIRAAIQKQIPFQVSGPIGIYRETATVVKTAPEQLLEFTAFLSINLFMVNLLPLPALDGGRLVFIFLEWLRRGRRVPPEKEGFVHAIGMVMFIALMLVVTFMDYMRYYG